MKEYHKIQSVYKRDPFNMKRLIEGEWTNDAFEYLAHNKWVFTEKVDGTNIRVMVMPQTAGGNVEFGGKTGNASIPSKLVTRLHSRFMPQQALLNEMFPEGACLYGEGYGASIQKGGGNYRQDQDFVLFDVKIGDWWLSRESVSDIATKLGLDVVPIIGTGTLHDAIAMTRVGFNSQWGSFKAEGIVARPAVELKTRAGERIITKIKTRDFQA